MRDHKPFAISLLVIGGLVASSMVMGRGRLIYLGIFLLFPVGMIGLRAARVDRNGTLSEVPLARGYRRRQTDAGKWTEAPIAEVDKSTFGKLLASRMKREPGLQVYVRGSGPEAPADPLYDPDLDGRP